MSLRITILCLALLVGPLLGQKAGEVPRHRPEANVPRGEVLEWTSKAGQPFWYRVPAKKDFGGNLLLMLHGTGVPQGWAFWNYPIGSGKFRGADIVVAPEGVTPGAGKSFNFVQGKPDAEQILDIIRTFRSAFEIERVYLYGHSQGAFFCYWFAGSHPEAIDGIVAHAGNLLANVPHPELAKEKVAIGILHGRADAVVPVGCATSTEKALRELGYRKLKLEIVEGLTKRSGHWPLPVQAAAMLDWLDRVSVADAASGIAVLERALAAKAPDLADLLDYRERAEQLLKQERGKTRKELQPAFETASAQLETRLGRILAELAELDHRAKDDGAEQALFRLVVEPLADHDAFRKEQRSALSSSRSADKKIGKILKRLTRRRDSRSIRRAVEILEKELLAGRAAELAAAVAPDGDTSLEELPAKIRDRAAARLKELAELEAAAKKKLAELLGADEKPDSE